MEEKKSLVGRRLYALMIDLVLLCLICFLLLPLIINIYKNCTDYKSIADSYNHYYEIYKADPSSENLAILNQYLNPLMIYNLEIAAIDIFVSGMIDFCVLPLILRKGRTLGKLIAKINLVDAKGNYIRWYILLLRSLLFVIMNLLLGVFSLGIVPLINLLVCIIRNDNRTLYDLICRTDTVDGKIPLDIMKNAC